MLVRASQSGTHVGFASLLAVGVLMAIILIWLRYQKKKREEEYYREIRERSLEKRFFGDSFSEETVSPDSSEEEEKDSDDMTGAVKYSRGFGKDEDQQKKKPTKETEEFYRYPREENDRIPCSYCGVENPSQGENCLMCGRPLR